MSRTTMSSSEHQALPSGVTIKNGRYYSTPRINGKRKWIGLTRVSEGPKKLHEALQQLDLRPRPRTVADLLARFAAEGRGDRAEATWHKYVQVCTYPTSKLLMFFGDMRIEAVCVIRAMSVHGFTACRSRISRHAGQGFRGMSVQRFTACRSSS